MEACKTSPTAIQTAIRAYFSHGRMEISHPSGRAYSCRCFPRASEVVLPQPDSGLPDMDPLPFRQVQLILRLNAESRVPGIHITNHSVDPILWRAMRVAHHLVPQACFPIQRSPHLSPGHKEPLISAESVHCRG